DYSIFPFVTVFSGRAGCPALRMAWSLHLANGLFVQYNGASLLRKKDESVLYDLVYLSTQLFTIRRWNTKPLVEVNTEASNTGFSMHVAFLLARLEEQAIDMEKLLLRMVLKDLPKCILSDISLETKRFIREESPDLWEETFSSAVEDVLKKTPEAWQDTFRVCMKNAKDDSPEGRIIQVADLYSATIECDINRRVFGMYFEETFQDLEKELFAISDLLSIGKLLRSDTLREYLVQLRSLIHAIRWNQHNRHVQTSVAGHTFFVVFVSVLLHGIAHQQGVSALRLENVLLKALFHDVPESITGDIISPTKRRVPGFEQTIERVEKRMVKQTILEKLPQELQREVEPFMLQPFSGREGKLVRGADLLGSLFECMIEIKSGNRNPFFRDAYAQLLRELEELALPEVNTFLELGLPEVL
ncbi:MAG TPA: HD domain-containing protein, partial [Thermotogota bacterium]|nr:HD domain-containing protein [Thermotogota bacterium]